MNNHHGSLLHFLLGGGQYKSKLREPNVLIHSSNVCSRAFLVIFVVFVSIIDRLLLFIILLSTVNIIIHICNITHSSFIFSNFMGIYLEHYFCNVLKNIYIVTVLFFLYFWFVIIFCNNT